jgi:hypothetical protein
MRTMRFSLQVHWQHARRSPSADGLRHSIAHCETRRPRRASPSFLRRCDRLAACLFFLPAHSREDWQRRRESEQSFSHPSSPDAVGQIISRDRPAWAVFLSGEWKNGGPLAHAFVNIHRFTAVEYRLPLATLLVGVAGLLAKYSGTGRS